MFGFLPRLGSFQVGRNQTAAAGTAITALVPPLLGSITHVNELVLLAGSTAHDLYLLRPLNYTTLSADAAAAQAVVAITADPGVYSTNYLYPLLGSGPNGQVPATLPTFQTADNAISANDLVVIETPDGAFWQTKVSSVSSLNITMTGNVPTGGLKKGARFWFYGISSDTDPANALGQFRFTTTVSVSNSPSGQSGANNDFFQALHPYDPILFFDANATAADTLNRLEGFYSKF